MVPRAHGDEPYSDSQHRADSEEAPSGRGWTITGHHQRRLVGGSPVRMGLPPGVDCGGGRGYRRCCADPMAGLANAGTMGLTSRRGHGGGAAVVVSGPDVGAGHPGGWLGPSQGWISPPSRRAVAGWEAWHGSDGAPGRPIHPLPAARRSTESRFYRPFHPFYGRGAIRSWKRLSRAGAQGRETVRAHRSGRVAVLSQSGRAWSPGPG